MDELIAGAMGRPSRGGGSEHLLDQDQHRFFVDMSMPRISPDRRLSSHLNHARLVPIGLFSSRVTMRPSTAASQTTADATTGSSWRTADRSRCSGGSAGAATVAKTGRRSAASPKGRSPASRASSAALEGGVDSPALVRFGLDRSSGGLLTLSVLLLLLHLSTLRGLPSAGLLALEVGEILTGPAPARMEYQSLVVLGLGQDSNPRVEEGRCRCHRSRHDLFVDQLKNTIVSCVVRY